MATSGRAGLLFQNMIDQATLAGGLLVTRNSASPALKTTNSGSGDSFQAGTGFGSNGLLRVGPNTSGTRNIFTINTINGVMPDTSRFLIADTAPIDLTLDPSLRGSVMADFQHTVTGVAGDVGTVRFMMSQTGVGAGTLIRALEVHTIRGALAIAGAASWIAEMGLHVAVAGAGVGVNVGIRLASEPVAPFGVATAVRANEALYILGGDGAGNGGWTNAIRYEENGVLLYNLDRFGVVTAGDLAPLTTDTNKLGDPTKRYLALYTVYGVFGDPAGGGGVDGGLASGPVITSHIDTQSGYYFPASAQLASSIGGTKAWLLTANDFQIEKVFALKHSSTPTTPSGYLDFYAKNDNKLYLKANGGSEIQVLDARDRVGVRVSKSGTQSIPDATVTAVTFDTETYDDDTMHSTSSNTDRLVATTAGRYRVTAKAEFATNATGLRYVDITDSGGTTRDIQWRPAVTGQPTTVTAQAVVVLTAAQYVFMRVYQNTGITLNLNGGATYDTWFEMTRIG